MTSQTPSSYSFFYYRSDTDSTLACVKDVVRVGAGSRCVDVDIVPGRKVCLYINVYLVCTKN